MLRAAGTPMRRAARALLTFTVMSGLLAVGCGHPDAGAAPPFASTASVDSIGFAEGRVESGGEALIKGTWSLPARTAASAGFVVDLPKDLKGMVDAFPISDPDGKTMGQCTVTQSQLSCGLDEAYLKTRPRGVHGTFSMWVEVTTKADADVRITYEFGKRSASVVVTPSASEACAGFCKAVGRGNGSWGRYDREADEIAWVVQIEAGPQGRPGAEPIVVDDRPGSGQTLIADSTAVYRSSTLRRGRDGQEVPINWTRADPRSVTVRGGGGFVEFVSDRGYFYELRYRTKVEHAGRSAIYNNRAEITIGSASTKVVQGVVARSRGSGTVIAVTKRVDPSPSPRQIPPAATAPGGTPSSAKPSSADSRTSGRPSPPAATGVRGLGGEVIVVLGIGVAGIVVGSVLLVRGFSRRRDWRGAAHDGHRRIS